MPAQLAAMLGSQLVSSAVQGGLQMGFDNMTASRNLGFYNMQRQHAIQDWQMQNEYNSPKAQMQRLREAGISPYALGGNALFAGGSNAQVKQAQMNTPSSYQVNSAQNQMANVIALENAKLVAAQREKTQAETQAIKLNYDVDNETLRSRRLGEIWTAQAVEALTKMSTEEKAQNIQSMKAQSEKVLQEIKLEKLREIYENDFLKGRNDLQNIELRRINKVMNEIDARIQSIRFNTEKDRQLLPMQIQEIQRRIEGLKLGNESKNYENVMMPDYLHYRNEDLREGYRTKKIENETRELKNWQEMFYRGLKTYAPKRF